jgi:hypothetical protein
MQEHSSQRADNRLMQVATLGYQRAGKAVAIGLLILDTQDDQLWVHFPHDLARYVEPEDLDIFECLAQDLKEKAQTLGTGTLFEYLENTLSNVLLISDRIPVRNSAAILDCAAQNIFGQPFPATQDILRLTKP